MNSSLLSPDTREKLAKSFRAQTLGFLAIQIEAAKFDADWQEMKQPYLDSVDDFLALLHHFGLTVACKNPDGTLADIALELSDSPEDMPF